MTAVPLANITTDTGCNVRVFDGEQWPDMVRLHGPGVMVTLDMNQPGDGRHAEVYLDAASVTDVMDGLGRWVRKHNDLT